MAQLNKFIPDNQLPNVLLRPLVFGNRSQINALNELEVKIGEMERERAKHGGKEMRLFDITIEYSATYDTKVWAINKEAAIEKAREESDLTGLELEEDYATASERHYKMPKTQERRLIENAKTYKRH